MSKSWIPRAGDLIKIDFDPQAGHEQAGWRPALVEVTLPAGCPLQGVVLADHVKSADLKARGAKHVGVAPQEVVRAVRAYITLLIGAK